MIAVLLLPLAVHAQVHRCKSPEGKIVYSDVVCPSSGSSAIVNVRPNSVDHSGLRALARKNRQEDEDRRIDEIAARPPAECKFQTHGDTKGTTLAQNATRECVENLYRRGQPASKESYAAWRDHYTQREAERQAAAQLAQSVAQQAQAKKDARATRNAIAISAMETQAAIARGRSNAVPRVDGNVMTCRPNVIGTELNCK